MMNKLLLVIILILTSCTLSRYYESKQIDKKLKEINGQIKTAREVVLKTKAELTITFNQVDKNKQANLKPAFAKLQNHLHLMNGGIDQITAANDRLASKIAGKKRINDKDPEYKTVDDWQKYVRKKQGILEEEQKNFQDELAIFQQTLVAQGFEVVSMEQTKKSLANFEKQITNAQKTSAKLQKKKLNEQQKQQLSEQSKILSTINSKLKNLKAQFTVKAKKYPTVWVVDSKSKDYVLLSDMKKTGQELQELTKKFNQLAK